MNNTRANVLWLTGMSGSGKTTLASVLELFLLDKGLRVYVLDGDDIRGKDDVKLGFGHKDVMINNLRISDLCLNIRSDYDVIIIPVISPYDDIRIKVRAVLEPDFHLVYLKSDTESLRTRDTKGLYSAADKGLITDLIGYSDVNPYDEPDNAEVVVETGEHISVEESTRELLEYVNKLLIL